MRHRTTAGLMLGLALVLPACSARKALPPNLLKVSAVDYGFNVTGEAQSGPTTIEFSNDGKEFHHLIIGRLDDGKTLDDVTAALESGAEEPPAWFHDDPIDLGIVDPGRTQTGQIDLDEPGTYAFLCMMPSPDGAPHGLQGMVKTVEIGEGPANEDPLPNAQPVSLTEYEIEVGELSAGTVTLDVRNNGTENHDLNIVQIDEGKTGDDVDAWFGSGMEGTPPIRFFAGTHDFPAGDGLILSADLEAGTYLFVCTVETDDGKKHADDLGMQVEVTIT